MATLKTISPIDGSLYVERPYADNEQIQAVLSKAEQAQAAWRSTPLDERKAICSRAVDAFVANKEIIARELCWQMGRPIRYAANEVNSFAERSRYTIDCAAALDSGHLGGRYANLKEENRNCSFFDIPVRYAKRNSFPCFIRHNNHELTRLCLFRNSWNFYFYKVNIWYDLISTDNLVHFILQQFYHTES